jgi:uncharacterized protein (TIGR03118 family)
MLNWLIGVARFRHSPSGTGRPRPHRPTLECLEDRTVPSTAFFRTNLVSDVAGAAQITDPNLKNPWGAAVNPVGDFWISDAANGTVTLYGGDVNGQPIRMDAPVITIPGATSGTMGQPSGQVFNSTSDFVVPGSGSPALFIFAGIDGTLSAVAPNFYTGAPSSNAVTVATVKGASYTGLALGSNASGNFLFAANNAAGTVDVFDKNFKHTTLSGSFTDPNLPANMTPFNVVNINGTLYVTYENPNNESVGGLVDKFDTNGNFLGRFAGGTNLVAPWAVVQAPTGFGSFGGDILVGNFGDGHISAYDTSGHFLGQLNGQNGQPLAIERLWQLTFGNGSSAGGSGTLYFTSGLNKEKDGVFGALTPMTANQRFVAQAYNDLLQRPADPAGLAFWTNQLTQGASRQQIVAGIEGSGEYEAVVVNRLFRQFLHRGADAAGLSFWSAQLAAGATVEQVAAGIVGSQEFFMSQGGGTTNGFLAALYQDALGRAPDTMGQSGFAAALHNGASTTQVAAVVFGSGEFLTDQVQGFFQSFLHRAADSAGLSGFVPALQQGATDQQVIAVIVASGEYFAKL